MSLLRENSRTLVAAALLLAGACPLAADTPAFDARVEQWGTQELVMRSAREYANPVTEVQLTCRFQSGNRTVTVDGFYDGGHTWKIRFMPDVQGEWTFTTLSSDAELNAKSGKFIATAPGRGNHGPIRVAKTYHFSYADGTPYFLLGTTTYGGLSGGAESRIATVRKLADSPFNKSRFMLPGFPGRGGPGEPPFELKSDGNMDYSRPNPKYYVEVENGLRDLRTLGIEADLILFVPYGPPGSTSSMGEENDIIYLKYAVARLASFRNVWWTLTNEFDVNRVPKNNQKLGTLVRDMDPYKHVIGIHHCCTAYYDNREPWITHYILQDLTLQRLAAVPRNDAFLELDARKVGKPVLVDEYGYEGNNGAAWGAIGPREMVEQHWAITMSGAYASHGESYAGFGMNADRFVGDSPKRLGFLKQIMMEAPFQDMEPASDIVTLQLPTANPNPAYVVTALAKRGSYYLIHFPEPKEASTWNLGVYGPATPSKPLPPPDPGKQPPSTFDAPAEIRLGEGTFRVDLIDTWLMNVRTIGYTKGPSQKFRTPLAPGIIRFVKVDSVPAGAQVADVSDLGRTRP